jgi:hypothetical protein
VNKVSVSKPDKKHLKDLGLDARTMLKCVFNGVEWIYLARIRISGRLL